MRAEIVADSRWDLGKAMRLAGDMFYRWRRDAENGDGYYRVTFYTSYQDVPEDAVYFPCGIKASTLADVIADSSMVSRYGGEPRDARRFRVFVDGSKVRVEAEHNET